jgi:hypothetical protein
MHGAFWLIRQAASAALIIGQDFVFSTAFIHLVLIVTYFSWILQFYDLSFQVPMRQVLAVLREAPSPARSFLYAASSVRLCDAAFHWLLRGGHPARGSPPSDCPLPDAC